MQTASSEFYKSKKENVADLFKIFPKEKYPNLGDLNLTLISMFGSTYVCERALLGIKYMKSKYRNFMKDKMLEEILRISLTKADMDIDVLVVKHL